MPNERPVISRKTEALLGSFGVSTDDLHLVVASADARSRCKSITTHVWTGYKSASLFVRIAPNVYVSSPELCFIQMASVLPFFQTIALGFELCGRYMRADAGGKTTRGDRPEPVTTVARLRACCDAHGDIWGSRQAKKALPYVIENSYSPRETVTAMLLSLPRMYGGEGLPRPVMNPKVAPRDSSERGLAGAPMRCDLYWPAKRVGIEYDSDECHSDKQAMTVDSQRRTAFANRGVTVITLTNDELKDVQLFDQTTKRLRKLLKVRRRDGGDYCWAIKRYELRKALSVKSRKYT